MEIFFAAAAVLILLETSYLSFKKLREKRLKVARGSLLLDTSAIMDGRIVDVAKSGIITAEVIIPRSVIRELQLLADKADGDKRARARHGLDNVRVLQKLENVGVTVVNDGLVDKGGVDERLLELATRYDASVATTDYNLNKVAKVVGVTVVNVNELAQMLRAQYLPGERVDLTIIQAGQNRDQGVGYLDDGTMVVVENAKHLIGQKMKVEIQRSLQTEAGRMMFARKVNEVFHSDQLKKPARQPKRFMPNQIKENRPRPKAVEPVKTDDRPPRDLAKSGRPNHRANSTSAEDRMVELANQSK